MALKKTVHIIGGSIAGCCSALAILKNSTDYTVKIFERSPGKLHAQGAGIAISNILLEHLKQKDYLDIDFPAFKFERRHFVVADRANEEGGRTIWHQSFSAAALHWNELFQNLRKRIPDDIYFSNQEVVSIDCNSKDKCFITLKNGETLTSDLIISADGHNSISRKLISSEAQPRYANYIAWRGVVPFESLKDVNIFQGSVPIYLNPKGHLLFYPIFENSQKLLNWVFFEKCDDHRSRQLLIDKTGRAHQSSLFPGQVSDSNKQLLYDYALQTLPKKLIKIIYATKDPFLQRVFDIFMPSCRFNRLISLGDAATILAPNTASGATKALQDALNLGHILGDPNFRLDQALDKWNEQQVTASKVLHRLSGTMSNALILNPPDWQTMNAAAMDIWWKNIIKDDKWYATDT